MIEISVRMGIPAKIVGLKPGELMIARAPHRRLEIELRGINFNVHGTDRGGLIGDITTAAKRAAPCSFPFAHFVLGFNGMIAPCCHIRSDRPEHAPYVYGNLRDYGSIFQAFTSRPAAAWRRELASARPKLPPCDTCSAGVVDDPQALKVFAAAHQAYVEGQPA